MSATVFTLNDTKHAVSTNISNVDNVRAPVSVKITNMRALEGRHDTQLRYLSRYPRPPWRTFHDV